MPYGSEKFTSDLCIKSPILVRLVPSGVYPGWSVSIRLGLSTGCLALYNRLGHFVFTSFVELIDLQDTCIV